MIRPSDRRPTPPLDGVRVLDLTQFIAGPGATRMLAALGAEVLKVEWRDRLDNIRFNGPYVTKHGEEPVPLVVAGVNAARVPSDSRSGLFNEMNAGKLGIGLNLKSAEDVAAFGRLAAKSDIVIENFSAGTMERLGLDDPTLHALNPSLVIAHASAFGTHGRRGVSYGPTAEAEAGLTYLSGLPGREPAGWGYAYMDETAGYLLALAVLAGLRLAGRGVGGISVDLAQVGSAILHTGTAVADWSMSGRASAPLGNTGSYDADVGPRNVYRCRGADEWLAVSVHSDEQWRALCQVIGRPELEAGNASPTVRRTNQAAIDSAVTGWTASMDKYEAMAALQHAGVPAGACQTARDRATRDVQLAYRGFLEPVINHDIGWWPVEQLPYRFSRTPALIGADEQIVDPDGARHRGAPGYAEDEDRIARLGRPAQPSAKPAAAKSAQTSGLALNGIRVVELSGEYGEFAGRLFAALGAEVIKVEPGEGCATRRLGPFAPDGVSVYFRQYNLGKKSVVCDLESIEGRAEFIRLLGTADVLLHAPEAGQFDEPALDPDAIQEVAPHIVYCSITPFGRKGPWSRYLSDDLVSLALGGQTMVCGYDPTEFSADGRQLYDTPPVTPSMYQAAHMTGGQAACAVLAALHERERSGLGQLIDFSVHDACAGTTEITLPMWNYAGLEVHRQTCRQAWPAPLPRTVFRCGDGRWVYLTYIGAPVMWQRFVQVMADAGETAPGDQALIDYERRNEPEAQRTILGAIERFCLSRSASEIVRLGQQAGLPWGVVRRPEENSDDEHWRKRRVIIDVAHADRSRHAYLGSPWVSDALQWRQDTPAPDLGADTLAVLGALRHP